MLGWDQLAALRLADTFETMQSYTMTSLNNDCFRSSVPEQSGRKAQQEIDRRLWIGLKDLGWTSILKLILQVSSHLCLSKFSFLPPVSALALKMVPLELKDSMLNTGRWLPTCKQLWSKMDGIEHHAGIRHAMSECQVPELIFFLYSYGIFVVH